MAPVYGYPIAPKVLRHALFTTGFNGILNVKAKFKFIVFDFY
jgi:hypothetical protein